MQPKISFTNFLGYLLNLEYYSYSYEFRMNFDLSDIFSAKCKWRFRIVSNELKSGIVFTTLCFKFIV